MHYDAAVTALSETNIQRRARAHIYYSTLNRQCAPLIALLIFIKFKHFFPRARSLLIILVQLADSSFKNQCYVLYQHLPIASLGINRSIFEPRATTAAALHPPQSALAAEPRHRRHHRRAKAIRRPVVPRRRETLRPHERHSTASRKKVGSRLLLRFLS